VDASRAVGVARALLDPAQHDGFVARTRDEYASVRTAHEGRDRKEQRLTLAQARDRRLRIDWQAGPVPPTPTFIGARAFLDHPLEDLVERLDWGPFFQAWELSGRYPDILTDPTVGSAASALFRDAQRMLERIVRDRSLHANAVTGFWPAGATDADDIVIYGDTARTEVIATIHTLRQQFAKTGDRPDLALSDFVAPIASGVPDHIGMFAVTAGVGLEELRAAALRDHDDYASIMAAALADRLAEAFAERLHELVRRELWGYVPDETLDNDALIAERYQGIRPAPGYPACPDHTEKATIFRLLDAERAAGITLTESMAMLPGASVSGLYLWHPDAHYFGLGRIDRDQLEEYAGRKGWSIPEAERWLAPNLVGGIMGG
jgi:5-methyltetrahydrofolate--homocysteine methyltransferase